MKFSQAMDVLPPATNIFQLKDNVSFICIEAMIILQLIHIPNTLGYT